MESKSPFFSVIIPVYNRETRLAKALQSLNEQTFRDFETIIIDDASTDNSFDVAHGFDLPNKTVVRNETNSERCISRNRGIGLAKGEYICFLDSDDYHLPEHFEKLHRLIVGKGKPEAFFFSNAWNETETGERSSRYCPDYESVDPFVYFLRYTVNPQRWAVHRNIMQLHLFDPEVTIAEDMDTSLRMVADGVPVYQLKERTSVYVAASDSFTHGASNKWERELENIKRIFAKPELKGKLPRWETNRLLSMCHYHLAARANENGRKAAMYKHGIKSFFLYPASYNGSTNKPLFVMMVYGLPILGCLIRNMVRLLKRKKWNI